MAVNKQKQSAYLDDQLLDRPKHEHHFLIAEVNRLAMAPTVFMVCYCGEGMTVDFATQKVASSSITSIHRSLHMICWYCRSIILLPAAPRDLGQLERVGSVPTYQQEAVCKKCGAEYHVQTTLAEQPKLDKRGLEYVRNRPSP
jgi:hypothetical protein